MKYIRTKDKILSNSRLNIEDVVRQANTIEELCDEFVQDELLYDGECKYYILPKCEGKPIETVMRGIKQHLKYGNIYGAIWTDKGLIYVAKINNKMEFELL